MAALTGTTDTYLLKGNAEDFHDAIYDISPTETPVMTACKRLKATSTLHQWQTDSLASAALNAKVEGDDATFASASPTTILSNRTMISSKTVLVSRTADSIRKYGRSKEIARLVTKYGKELKRDIETALLGQQGSSAGNATTARQAAGFRSMVGNARYASGSGNGNTTGTQPAYAAADWTIATDGSNVSMTELDLRAALELAWIDGGDASMLVMNSKQKRQMATFGGATAFDGFGIKQGVAQGAVVGGIDVYVSDYGSHKVVLDRFIGQTGVLCLDPEYIGLAWLDPIKVEDLAKTGDAEKKLIVCEWTAVMQNPDAHAQIKGCLTT